MTNIYYFLLILQNSSKLEKAAINDNHLLIIENTTQIFNVIKYLV